jgi:hypothetical protein
VRAGAFIIIGIFIDMPRAGKLRVERRTKLTGRLLGVRGGNSLAVGKVDARGPHEAADGAQTLGNRGGGGINTQDKGREGAHARTMARVRSRLSLPTTMPRSWGAMCEELAW